MPSRSPSRLRRVAVDLACPFRRDVAVLEVAFARGAIALLRVSVTGAIAGRDADDVAAVDGHTGGKGIALAFAGRADHLDVVWRAVGAAFQAPGRDARARIAEGEERPVAA